MRGRATAVEVSPLLWDVLTTALQAARATDGRYDPTLQRHMLWIGYDRTFADIDAAARRTTHPAGQARDWAATGDGSSSIRRYGGG